MKILKMLKWLSFNTGLFSTYIIFIFCFVTSLSYWIDKSIIYPGSMVQITRMMLVMSIIFIIGILGWLIYYSEMFMERKHGEK